MQTLAKSFGLCIALATAWTLSIHANAVEITHGPILGRLGSEHIGVWARTDRPAAFRVHYGAATGEGQPPAEWAHISPPVATHLVQDNTGWVQLQGLSPHAKYFYEVVPDGGAPTGTPDGSFRTLPSSATYQDSERNPRGLFNFSFEFACGNHQPSIGRPGKIELVTYDTMLKHHKADIDFALLNGDWLYEEYRGYTVDAWRRQVGITAEQTPDLVRNAPHLVGVWENYKLYLDRADALTRWHREVPSFFMFDDHEIVDDCSGGGTVGARPRRGVFRDIGLRAWYDYLGWSNPLPPRQGMRFGRAHLQAGSNILHDENADFESLNLDQAMELHVHWGGPYAGLKEKKYDTMGGDPNAGVYRIVRVLDPYRVQIEPAARTDGTAAYSIGQQSYFRTRMANFDFVYLDTRSHRSVEVKGNPHAEGISVLGARQKAWMKKTMTESDADGFFVVSSVNFMIPHIADVGTPTANQDSWTGYIQERNELIDFFDGLDQNVMLLTGDLHNSFAVRIADNVFEYGAGPHNSGNARADSEGGRPPNGVYDSYGRKCFIRWSSWFESDFGVRHNRMKIYCIVQVNNIFKNPSPEKPERWQAYEFPQVIFRYHDGYSGRLLYAESVLMGEGGGVE